ncbi:tetratricopeptide repeat-containing sensor histidine kinase [Flavobacterium suncheonense]|uniref:tetratricopeptide repeat-containing sensor histidine kinase n=1 Tax=Flavobacterium suncheonense TaxID=350894 RepID=UPI003FA35607
MNKIIFLIVICVLISCERENTALTSNEKDQLKTLLDKANNFNYSKKERAVFTDQAASILKQSKDSSSLNYLFKIADGYYNSDDNLNYFTVSKHILRKAIRSKDSSAICKAYSYIGDYYYYEYKYDSAYYYYSKVEKNKTHIKSFKIYERSVFNKASILLFERNFSQAEVEFVKLLKNAKTNKNERIIYEAYLGVGLALRGMNNNKGAIEYYTKALKQTDKLKTDNQYNLLKAQTLNYIAIAYQKDKDFEKAFSLTKQALDIDQFRRSNPDLFCYLMNTHSYSKFMLGDESCLKDFYNILQLGDSLSNVHIQLNSKINLSEYYLKKKNVKEAEKYSKEVLHLARQNKIHEDELQALELLAKIDTSRSTYYREKYISLSDSLQSVERTTRNKFARIEFETDEITSEKKLIEAENRRISAQRRLIMGFSLFLIIALVLLYIVKAQRTKNRELQYKQKQQQANFEIYQLMLDQHQKIEEGKQMEKQRISRELHDGVMGKLTAIRLNLFILNKKNDPETIARCMKQVDEIQNIEKEIRKIAHDLNQNLFADTSDFVLMVDNLVANIKEHSTVRFRVTADEVIDWTTVSSAVKIQVYRILQESLQNIGKYAKAENVSITMLKKDNAIVVSVTDDGVGFNTNQAKGGIGLKNMKERAAEIGATLKILSEKQQGTQIILTIPT